MASLPFSFGGTESDNGNSVATDSVGNFYVAGVFGGSFGGTNGVVDFDPGPGTANLSGRGSFLAKYAADGSFAWARVFGSTFNAQQVAVDASGNAYMVTNFTGVTTITGIDSGNLAYTGPSLTSHSTTSKGKSTYQQDGVVVKFDPSGTVLWASQFGGTNATTAYSVAIHADGSGSVDGVLISGQFAGTVDFDPGAGTSNLSSAGSNDTFVVKLDGTGGFAWARRAGSTGDDGARGIAVAEDGSALVTGHFTGSDPFGSNFPLSSNGDTDTFLAKLNSDGTLSWVRGMGGAGSDRGYGISVSSESVYVAGREDNQVAATVSSVSKWSMNGDLIWKKQVGGGQDGVDTWGLTIDPQENVYLFGYYGIDNFVDFDPDAGEYLLPDLTVDNGFVVKLDSQGNFGGWATRLGSHARGATWDTHSGTLVVTGHINGALSTTFQACTRDACAGPILSSNGVWDVFVAKLDVATGLPDGYAPIVLTEMDAGITGTATTSGKNWQANATVTIVANGQPVVGATVTGTWSNSSTVVTGTTNSAGTVTFSSSNLAKSINSIDFTIANVQKSGFKYTPPDAIRIFQTGGFQSLSAGSSITMVATPLATSSPELSIGSIQPASDANDSGRARQRQNDLTTQEVMQLLVADTLGEAKQIESLFDEQRDEDGLVNQRKATDIDDELLHLLAADQFVQISSNFDRNIRHLSHE